MSKRKRNDFVRDKSSSNKTEDVSLETAMNFISESSTKQTNVSLRIAKHLFSKLEQSDKNIVFSPLSLQVILSIIAAGAEGPTQQQLLDFLQFESTDYLNSFASKLVTVILQDAAPAGGPCLSVANGVLVDQTLSLQPSFQQIVSNDFKATLAYVNFRKKVDEVIKKVNLWAKKETNGLIKELLSQGSVDKLTRLIFANALYFKGAWENKFLASRTKNYDFHLLNGSSVKVPFMTSEKRQFIRAFDGFKVLRLPYEQGEDKRQFSMYIFLPKAKDGLQTLVEKVASESELLHHKLQIPKVEVGDFRIPKFKFSFGFEASLMLEELEVILPFRHGGLTNIVDSQQESQNLYVSNIFHKSLIEVNEEGTEAAAVTVSKQLEYLGKKPVRITRINFVADHPFLFLIREDLTETILFVGQVLNPLNE